MSKLTDVAIKRGLGLNRQLAASVANGFDWLFRHDSLVKSGQTWFELVHDGDLMSVRYYALPDEDEIELADGSRMPIQRKQHAVPLVLVPPVGVTTETFDLMPQRSLVRFLAASGFKVYLVDWGKPKKEHSHLGLKDYSYTMLGSALDKVRQHSGSKDLSMLGWCMGGLFCLLYQGQTQDKHMRNIITVASPIDPEGGDSMMARMTGAVHGLNGSAQLVSNFLNTRFNTLDPTRLSLPPLMTTLVFKMTDPVASVTTYWDLVTRLSDREFVESHSTTSDYLNNMLMYPGGVVKDMASTVVGDNRFTKGEVAVGDNIAKLTAIKSNFLAFAGETDILVPPEMAQQSIDIIASKDKEFRIAPGGHMGVMLGSKAQKAVWAQSVEWLASRSAKAKVKAKKKNKDGANAHRKN